MRWDEIKVMDSRGAFIVFLEGLSQDFEANPEAWGNDNLADYLNGLLGCIGVSDPVQNPSWHWIAYMMLGATEYE